MLVQIPFSPHLPVFSAVFFYVQIRRPHLRSIEASNEKHVEAFRVSDGFHGGGTQPHAPRLQVSGGCDRTRGCAPNYPFGTEHSTGQRRCHLPPALVPARSMSSRLVRSRPATASLWTLTTPRMKRRHGKNPPPLGGKRLPMQQNSWWNTTSGPTDTGRVWIHLGWFAQFLPSPGIML